MSTSSCVLTDLPLKSEGLEAKGSSGQASWASSGVAIQTHVQPLLELPSAGGHSTLTHRVSPTCLSASGVMIKGVHYHTRPCTLSFKS